MILETFFISYGDEDNNNSGVYQVVNNTEFDFSIAYPMNVKPGALIISSGILYVSYKDKDNGNGVLKLKINPNELALLEDIKVDYFITSFCNSSYEGIILASSFFDGVDMLINVENGFNIQDVSEHSFTKGSSDSRQQECHPHHISIIENNLVCSVDMGTDAVYFYKIEYGKINRIENLNLEIDVGDGPRILRYSPINKHVYILNEISNSISVYDLGGYFGNDEDESSVTIRRKQKVSVSNLKHNSPSGFELFSEGKFIIATNRGEDSVILFDVDQVDGFIEVITVGKTKSCPRDVKVVEDHLLLTCQKSNCIEVFSFKNRKLKREYELNAVLAPIVFNSN